MNGKPYNTFSEQQSKIMKTWILSVNGSMNRIVLEKDTLDIWVNGDKVDMAGEFTDEGTETHFTVAGTPAFVRQEMFLKHIFLGNFSLTVFL